MLAVLAIVPLALVGCRDDRVPVDTGGTVPSTLPEIPAPGAPEQDRLDAARARWDAAGIEDYEWTYSGSCFCPRLTVTVRVEGGQVVDTQVVSEGQPAGTEADLQITTMLDLFDEVQRAIDTADSVTVEYDADTGRVISLDVDQITDAADDEYGYTVTSFLPR
jgi:hypothetical protein